MIDDDGSGSEAALSPSLSRLPSSMQRALVWLLPRWLGRIVIQGVRAFVRRDMSDRSMTIAAQFFTSVFPILSLVATWAASKDADRLGSAVSLPEETRSVLQEAMRGAGSGH